MFINTFYKPSGKIYCVVNGYAHTKMIARILKSSLIEMASQMFWLRFFVSIDFRAIEKK